MKGKTNGKYIYGIVLPPIIVNREEIPVQFSIEASPHSTVHRTGLQTVQIKV